MQKDQSLSSRQKLYRFENGFLLLVILLGLVKPDIFVLVLKWLKQYIMNPVYPVAASIINN